MLKHALLFTFLFVWHTTAHPQENNLDSLKRTLSGAAEDSNKVKSYLLAGKTVLYQNPAEAVFYFLSGAKLAVKIGYNRGAGLSYLSLGYAYSILSKTDSSLMSMELALAYLRKLNSPQFLANFFGNRADTYVQISNYKKALQDCDSAVRYIELTGNKTELAYIYNIRADIYWHLKQYELNREYVDKALQIHLATGNRRMVAQAYSDKADWHDVHREYNKAVSFYKQAIHIADSIQDESNLSRYHGSLADTYLKMNKTKEATSSALLALQMAQQEYNPVQEAYVHSLLCRIYTSQNKVEAALMHGKKGHAMAMNEIDFPLKQSTAAALAEAFKLARNIDSAYFYLLRSKELNDSLITQSFTKEIADLQIGFDLAQKEKQIQLLAKDKELQSQLVLRQRLLIAGTILLLIVTLIGLWTLLNRSKLKQQMKELELRNQIAADLHDEVGSSLSSIHLLSQMATKQGNEKNQQQILERMRNNAQDTIEKMSDIVWMIKPGETESGILKERMEQFANEITSTRQIQVHMQLLELEQVLLNMDQRKNLWLIFKEAVNNAVKYSGSQRLNISTLVENKQLILKIHDFGKGFESDSTRGNGLNNMQQRAKDLKATLTIDSQPDEGTLVTLSIPV